jgi:hypothetical protein
VRVLARTVPPRRALAAARSGLGPRRLLDAAQDAFLTEARARQYDTFLANPGPPGGTSTATYVFVTAEAPAPQDARTGGLGALGVVLVAVGALLAVGAGVVAWAHL